ncbi:hypothetical protein [Mesorhizobium sp. WSM4313]|uniref:hypothetical protein n=1 Tax=Mesorhizobium sp. WSM4313 TaxID=2029412 RepID=UPI001140FFD8|nr:hypothetical protein [Mesorhizobium sp. WSM4313]
MPIRRLPDAGVFEPEEVSVLQGIFDQICARGGIDRKSEVAEDMAINLIAYYQQGLRGEELVRAVVPKERRP